MSRQQKAIQDYLTHIDILKHHGVSDVHDSNGYPNHIAIQNEPELYLPLCMGPKLAQLSFVQSEVQSTTNILNTQDETLFKNIIKAIDQDEDNTNLLAFDEKEFSLDCLLRNLHPNIKHVVFLSDQYYEIILLASKEEKLLWNLFSNDHFSFYFSCIPSFSKMNEDKSLKKSAWEILQILK